MNIDWYNLRDSIIVTIWFLYWGIPMIWAVIYDYRYYKGAGIDKWKYGKEYVINKFNKSYKN